MELRDAIRGRRSVKHFDPEHAITDAEIKDLFEHVSLTPSSFNMQNWHFVAVRDKSVLADMKAASWNQAQVADCSVAVVIAGDLKGFEGTDRYLRDAPDDVRTMFEGMIPGFYVGKGDITMQEACRSVGLAAMTMMLMAKELGYDSCPMIGFDAAKVQEIVGLPAHLPPLMMVCVGKVKVPARPRMGLYDLQESVSLDRYGNHALEGEVPAH